MKFLADANVEKTIIDELRKMGHDIKSVSEEATHLEDVAILEIANNENRILLTNDKDFGEIVFRQRLISSGIVLLRVKGQDKQEKLRLLKKLLENCSSKVPNRFVVVTNRKFRFIPI